MLTLEAGGCILNLAIPLHDILDLPLHCSSSAGSCCNILPQPMCIARLDLSIKARSNDSQRKSPELPAPDIDYSLPHNPPVASFKQGTSQSIFGGFSAMVTHNAFPLGDLRWDPLQNLSRQFSKTIFRPNACSCHIGLSQLTAAGAFSEF